MRQIKCPNCGYRDEIEFSCGGEAHISRQDYSISLTDKEWSEYLFSRYNPKGLFIERWVHSSGCRRWFNVVRNTATDEILKIYNIGESPPNINGDDPNTPSGEPNIGAGNISSTFNKK